MVWLILSTWCLLMMPISDFAGLISQHFSRHYDPAKSEIGIISKHLVDKINQDIRAKTDLYQWRSTKDVITCFDSLESKKGSKFTKFDIVEFYPSISETPTQKAINFAKNFTKVDEDKVNLILHCRKSLLFDQSDTWVLNKGAIPLMLQ